MKTYYVLKGHHCWFAKEAFIEQGGLKYEWGKAWKKIQAVNIEHARVVAEGKFG